MTVLAGGLGWLGTNLGPYLFGAGAFLLAVGIVVRFGAERLFPRIELAANARTAELWNRFDRGFGPGRRFNRLWTEKSTEGMIDSANAAPRHEWRQDQEENEPSKTDLARIPAPRRNLRGNLHRKAPSRPPGNLPSPPARSGPDSLTGGPAPPDSDAPGDIAVGSATGEAPQGPPVPPEGPGAVPTDLPPPEDRPSPGPTPTADIEAELGGHQAIEPSAEELREMERNRRASHPDPGVLEPESGTDGLTDEEYFALVDQMRTPIVEANTYAKASDASDLQTSIIKQAQSNRREAKVRMDVLGKKGFSKKQHRGALEGMNAGMNPDQYGD